MDHGGVAVGDARRDEIVEKTERVEHGGLDIGYKRGSGKQIRIPERKGSPVSELVIDEGFPRIKLEHEVRAVERFSGE